MKKKTLLIGAAILAAGTLLFFANHREVKPAKPQAPQSTNNTAEGKGYADFRYSPTFKY